MEQFFYVDNVLTGSVTVDEAAAMFKKLCQLFRKCGMTLRKLKTNSQEATALQLIEMADIES